MKGKDLVVKHNSLIRSRYDYSLAELRLVISVASMVAPDDEDFREYVVQAKEYAALMGADARNTRKAVKKLGDMLLSKPLHIPTDTGFAICNWFSWYEYKNGKIHCSFHPNLKPYMLQLKEQFTKYRLENILRFKSVYSIRMYELAKSWESKGHFEISLDDFRAMFGLEKKYRLYGDVKRKVLERSIKEINRLSDIEITFEEKKSGKRVVGLLFSLKTKREGDADPLSSVQSFISFIRTNHVNETLYSGMAQTDSGDLVEVEFACSKDGKLYDKLTSKTLHAKKAEKVWDFLFRNAKAGKLDLFKEAA